jgi:hypothetical protein
VPLVRTLTVWGWTVADPTFAEQMVSKLETLLLSNPGAQTVTFDGLTVSYDELTDRYDYWRKQVLREQGKKQTFQQVDLGGF